MEPRIRPGDRVATADLGEGVVVEVLGDRANVTLEDVNNLVIGYSLSDLRTSPTKCARYHSRGYPTFATMRRR